MRFLSVALVAAALPVLLPPPASAQEVVAPANPDADRLADVVRRLGTAPRDLSALIEAGDLSFTLGDATAAAAFYKRAEAIDPNNGRVKGGIARILVNGERPGEALRYFEQAQRHGAPMARFADDRGLAYDLIGEQARAQADYQLALTQGGRDAAELDEVRRRYALSLGISGKRDEALAQIDGLLRRQDRGAWRAQAFILAMSGDVAGANKIATGMMPRGMASGLAAFFQRLPQLSPVDRAFAVHFGEVTPTPARLADARMAPVLPGAAPRVEMASAATIQPLPTPARTESRRRERTQVARNTVAPRPAIASPSPATAVVQPLPAEPTPGPAPTQVAQAATTSPVVSAPLPQPQTRPVTPAVAPVQVAAVTPRPRAVTPPLRVKPPRVSEDSILARIVAGISVPATELDVAPMPGAQRLPVVAPPAPSAASLEEAARAAERNAAADDQKRPRLAAAKRVAEKVAPAGEKVVEADTKPLTGRRARGKASADDKGVGTAPDRKARATDAAAEKAEAKPLDRKARAKELAAEKAKKEVAAREAAEKKAARAEPSRFWVQVASGANVDDMPKAWKGVQGKAKALGGQRAYTVRNRATNRLVTGPFKTEAEARAMVNTLNRQGLSAFSFTSEAGQKMTPLGKK
ncbi:SPOR domain-containing protein [Sphingomonas endophytica]|uniref:SPOR domain-containing protein n=1 Tax=Sphingomonas endophytica TaxID=869719 RepID=A0A147HXG3_9SPHN|nr:SPOR domain-containing protein [Sphingomonas endophytica]KTT69632.1 hypothetical protein NS334_14150 [Sphingomonas endophytica]